MKIWKKIALTNDCALMECAPGKVSTRHPACFIFPGAGDIEIQTGTLPEDDAGSIDARKMLRRILQETHLTDARRINFFVATYDENMDVMLAHRLTNMLQDYVSEDARAFVSQNLLPLLDNNQPVTIITTSYGGVMAEQVQRALRDALKARKMSDELIAHKMRSVTQISLSSSSNINPPGCADDPRHFTTFHVQFANDKMLEHLKNLGFQGVDDHYQPFKPRKAGRNILDIEFLKDGLAVMTGSAYPEYRRMNSQDVEFTVDAPGQPHALRYLLDWQARATPSMYRAFVNVLCASLYRNTPAIGMPPETINLREAIVRNPSFCSDQQSIIERGYLEAELGESVAEGKEMVWTGRVRRETADRGRA